MAGFRGVTAFVAAVALAVLAACAPKAPEVGPTFIGGTSGLELAFLPETPPAEIFDGAKFPFAIALQLRNVGEWDINNSADATVTISGIDPADFGVAPEALVKDSPTALPARKRDPTGAIIEGGLSVIEFPGLNFQRTLFGDVSTTIKATVCYSYGTKIATNLCIKKNLASLDPSVCLVNTERMVANSGAPVQLESVRESQAGVDSVLLTLRIKHVGVGRIAQLGSECSEEVAARDRVYLKVDTMMPGLSCSGLSAVDGSPVTGAEGYVTLYGGERSISCTQPTGGEGDFVKPVSITLSYDYEQSAFKTITIKHI